MDVIDLSPGIPTSVPSASRPNASVLSRFGPGERMLGVAILLVAALAGLRVNAVAAATGSTTGSATPSAGHVTVPSVPPIPMGPAARRTAGPLVTGTGSRLLLLGTTLTTYDVTSGVAARPFSDAEAGGAVIDAAGLTDGDVVITSLGEASGRAYAVEDGRRRDLGIATAVLPGLALDTAWLVDVPESAGPTRVRLVTLAGEVLAGPFAIPADWRPERAVPGGLLMAVGVVQAPYALHRWTPGSTSPGPLLAADVTSVASGGGHVLTVGANGATAVDGVRSDLPGNAAAYAVSPDGATLAALEPTSIVLLSRVEAPGPGRRRIALPAGSQPTSLAFSPSGWLFASLGSRVVAVGPGASVLTDIPAAFSDPTSDLLAAAAIARPANPRTGR